MCQAEKIEIRAGIFFEAVRRGLRRPRGAAA
jgi:hypothetical protein